MSSDFVIEEVVRHLTRRFGSSKRDAKARILTFGSSITCSINYSKLLHGNKYFFGLPPAILDSDRSFTKTEFGEFVLLVCGSADKILVLPRPMVAGMMRGVGSRRLDIFVDSGTYIFQTTKHPKCDVTEYLNAFPIIAVPQPQNGDGQTPNATPDRIHVKVQFALIALGQAEGCSVWVPTSDRNLSYQQQPLASRTISRLPNFGFDENTRRIVQNIDVLWLRRNVIRKAFEIESTTSVYSGLLRLNDLVLSQPNIQIDLYIAAANSKRDKVYNQLLRPSFQALLPKCEFVTFEHIRTNEPTRHLPCRERRTRKRADKRRKIQPAGPFFVSGPRIDSLDATERSRRCGFYSFHYPCQPSGEYSIQSTCFVAVSTAAIVPAPMMAQVKVRIRHLE